MSLKLYQDVGRKLLKADIGVESNSSSLLFHPLRDARVLHPMNQMLSSYSKLCSFWLEKIVSLHCMLRYRGVMSRCLYAKYADDRTMTQHLHLVVTMLLSLSISRLANEQCNI